VSTRAVTAPASAIRGRVAPISVWAVGVWVATAVYAAVLSFELIQDHDNFASEFDTALYDQLLWLLANGHEPFSTVVSRPMLGDHFQPGLVLLTPLYWLGLDIEGVFIAQSIGLALTAPALFALARASGATPALASLPAFLWLTCPWVASVNLFDFRPLTFVPVLLVLSLLAALQGRHALLVVSAILALSLKEDVSLTYFILGVILAAQGKRRVGAVLALGSAVWFIVASRIMQSLGGSLDAFGERFAGGRGDSVGGAFVWMAHHPLETIGDVIRDSGSDLLLLLIATGGLAVLAPVWMLLAAPSALHNVLSAHAPQHSLYFHYHLLALTGLFIAASIGVGRLGSLGRRARLGVTSLVAAAAAVAVLGGIQAHKERREGASVSRAAMQRALGKIPPNVPVAATPSLLPNVSRRVDVYTLPEPFIPIGWGSPLTPAEFADRAERVRFVAFREGDLPEPFYEGDSADVREVLLRKGFVVVARAGPVQILERP